MKSRETNPNRRLVETKDLVRFANELLIGKIGSGVRAISTEVQGDRVRWRCIFVNDQAMDQGRPILEEVESKLQGIFYWHAKVDSEYIYPLPIKVLYSVVSSDTIARHCTMTMASPYQIQ